MELDVKRFDKPTSWELLMQQVEYVKRNREYQQGRIPLYHMDVYRIEAGADDLGLDDYFEGDGLSVVEWGQQLGEYMPEDYLELILSKDDQDENLRKVELLAKGIQAEKFQSRILKAWEAE